MNHSFSTPAEIKLFTLAGDATVTLESEISHNHYTFKVERAKDRETGAFLDRWFVKVLTGPDNYSNYTYIGMLDEGGFRLTKASKMSAESVPVRGFNYFWGNIAADRLPPNMVVHHEGACGRCGRKLTVPESIQRGIGPDCWAKMGF